MVCTYVHMWVHIHMHHHSQLFLTNMHTHIPSYIYFTYTFFLTHIHIHTVIYKVSTTYTHRFFFLRYISTYTQHLLSTIIHKQTYILYSFVFLVCVRNFLMPHKSHSCPFGCLWIPRWGEQRCAGSEKLGIPCLPFLSLESRNAIFYMQPAVGDGAIWHIIDKSG